MMIGCVSATDVASGQWMFSEEYCRLVKWIA